MVFVYEGAPVAWVISALIKDGEIVEADLAFDPAIVDSAETITGLWTFDRDPGAPFAVAAGSAVVANLDADKLDGYEASQFAALAETETISADWLFSGDKKVQFRDPQIYIHSALDGYLDLVADTAIRLDKSWLFLDVPNSKSSFVGTSTFGVLHVRKTASGVAASQYGDGIVIEDSDFAVLDLFTPNTGYGIINFGDPQDADVGGIRYYHSDNSLRLVTSATEQVIVSSAGAMTVLGCVADGTCEIMRGRDALAIIEDILTMGDGSIDEHGHEHMDMKAIWKKYPFLIKKADRAGGTKYFDRLGAKSDLLYVAISQLAKRVEALGTSVKDPSGIGETK